MFRQIHRYPGLIAGLLVMALALSGSILSVMTALQWAGAPSARQDQISVSEMAGKIAQNYKGVEQIVRKPSGKIVVFYFDNDNPGADIVSPVTGIKVADYQPSGFERWMTEFHRSLFLDDTGRAIAGFGALAMLILSYSGLSMTAKRLGGWRNIFARLRGTGSQKLHVGTARIAVAGFFLTGITAIYMSLTTFGLIPDGSELTPTFPQEVNGGPTVSVSEIAFLKNVKLTQLRKLSFPYADDPSDVFSITTSKGSGYIDQSTGEVLVFRLNSAAQTIYEFMFMLHTGQGLWWLALLTGAVSLTIPVLAVTGTVIWHRTRRASPKISGNVSAQSADTIILVGSEGNSTWGFAKTLQESLTAQGSRVHVSAMNGLKGHYNTAQRMFVLTATYGEGTAPDSARNFLAKLNTLTLVPKFPVAVLGFGDRQFPNFCQFADDVDTALRVKGWPRLLPIENIDRQSIQEFSRWGTLVGIATGMPLELNHTPVQRKTKRLNLISRKEYGVDVQAPTSVFKFAIPEGAKETFLNSLFNPRMPKFTVGDLVGIIPPGSTIPRFYSLASSSRDGILEICVRKHPGGLCSEHLHSLEIGGHIDMFIQQNPEFKPASGKAPVILVGAGTGIGPLAGFIRANKHKRPMHLFFGGRSPQSDFLYEDEITEWLGDNRLKTLNTAFSRVADRAYVQDSLTSEAEAVRLKIKQGAQIMVCGGRDMAEGVGKALEAILIPIGICPAALKAEGRYFEDVY